ncbi:hypothetical protein [Alcanivorax sp.]|uniref:hypothetical protein n=1 Tax=Alcanivorax sp. TaxID=1872427 RepID=UPI0025BBD5C6|nr:hypothetical protein [Alcanivorax sp.]
MISPPTDNLYKFLAVLGLLIAGSSGAFWWNASSNFDTFFESNEEYINMMFEGAEAYGRFAAKTNEGIAIYNSVQGDVSSLSESQKKELDAILQESEELKIKTGALLDTNPAKRFTINSKLEKYQWARNISVLGGTLGVLVSGFGFYFWHVRLQRHIDHLHARATHSKLQPTADASAD